MYIDAELSNCHNTTNISAADLLGVNDDIEELAARRRVESLAEHLITHWEQLGRHTSHLNYRPPGWGSQQPISQLINLLKLWESDCTQKRKNESLKTRVADPYSFVKDPDPAF